MQNIKEKSSVTENFYTAELFETPLGEMLVVADNKKLFMAEFVERKNLDKNIARFNKDIGEVSWGCNKLTQKTKLVLQGFFSGDLTQFDLPIYTKGTSFQQKVWDQIQKIPYGKTTSYAQIAQSIGFPKSYRAVANAVGQNQLAIVIPCHRVINKNGNMGGYAGGVSRKEWLLNHESGAQNT